MIIDEISKNKNDLGEEDKKFLVSNFEDVLLNNNYENLFNFKELKTVSKHYFKLA